MDEPFSSLDAAMRSSVRSEVLSVLRRAGTTSILVTHDQDEALSMADQVAVLRHGVIAQLDTPTGLYGHPGDVELAQFLGESNVLDGEVHDGTATTALGSARGRFVERARRRAGRPGSWSGPSRSGSSTPPTGGMTATVESYEYYGHDAVVRIRPEADGLPNLVVRVTGGVALEPGRRVGLSVLGAVVVWPSEPGEEAKVPRITPS